MKLCLALLALLLVVTPAAAQNSVACGTPPLSGNVTTPTATYQFAVCVPATAQADGVMVEVNGTKSFPTITPEAANAAGKVAYPATVTLSGTGNHTIVTTYYTLTSGGAKQEGPRSVPFVLVYEKPVPTTAPTNHPR